jgi:glycosyltransferase involved in cell wall biosynthesis
MSRIAIDARQYSTSTGRYVFRLIQYLEQVDQQNDYVILLKPEDFDTYLPKNPRFNKQSTIYKEYSFGEQLGFAWQLLRLKADLVHFGMTQQPVLYRRAKVTTIHDLTTARFYNPAKNRLVFAIKQRVYRFVTRRVARDSMAILAPSGFVKDDVAAFARVDPDKIIVTPEAADHITAKPEPIDTLKDRQFLMYVGRPTPHKNLERLIDAFAALQKQHPDLVLVLGGESDSNFRRIEAGARRRRLKNIVFTGYLNEGQLRWLYENCAVYVFPSLSEGFGLPGLEAMAHGAPVVSSNATCLPEVYGSAARYFDPTDTNAMASAINEVLTDQNLRQKLINRGHERVKKYSWHRMAEQTLAAYEQVLDRGSIGLSHE